MGVAGLAVLGMTATRGVNGSGRRQYNGATSNWNEIHE